MFSKIHNNSSIYDPFWHVAPIPIVFYIASQSSLSIFQQSLVLSAFLFWAMRLTYNWFLNWTNLDHEDFRYIELKDNNKLLAFVNDLFGIHLIPTLIVNASLYPIYVALSSDYLNNLVYVGFILIIFAVVIQYVADAQMRDFRKDENNLGKTMKYGLWKYSRHPNYLGEIILWTGVAITSFSSLELYQMFTLISPLFTYLLLVHVSGINLLEKNGEKKWGHLDEYKVYKEKTPRLFLFL